MTRAGSGRGRGPLRGKNARARRATPRSCANRCPGEPPPPSRAS